MSTACVTEPCLIRRFWAAAAPLSLSVARQAAKLQQRARDGRLVEHRVGYSIHLGLDFDRFLADFWPISQPRGPVPPCGMHFVRSVRIRC